MKNFNSNAPAVNQTDLNAGSIMIEQNRAVAEAQGKLAIAKRFPRDENRVYEKLMQSCKRQSLAQVACYSFPRGGKSVEGASIRLAEEIARIYGNIEYGIRELSNSDGMSEMQAYALDLENNVCSLQNFKVRHQRKAYGKMQKLTDTRDVYELTANMGARRLRARLLAILPPDLVESAVKECRKTLLGSNDMPIKDKIRSLLNAFTKLAVNQDMIEKYLDHSIDLIDDNEVVDLRNIYNSIKNSQSKREDWFVLKEEKAVTAQTGFKAVEKKPKEVKKAKEEPKDDKEFQGFDK